MVLFDMPDCFAEPPMCASGQVQATNPQRYQGLDKLDMYLCTQGVTGSAIMYQCAPEYYSYTNLFNPFPCVEVLFAQAFLDDSSYYTGFAPFIPFEDVDICGLSYGAT